MWIMIDGRYVGREMGWDGMGWEWDYIVAIIASFSSLALDTVSVGFGGRSLAFCWLGRVGCGKVRVV